MKSNVGCEPCFNFMSKRLFTEKELSTEEGRREYYRVDLGDPDTIRNDLVEPYLNPAFNEELLDRYGTDAHGDQLIRVVWAVNLRAWQYKDIGVSTMQYLGRKYPWNGGFRLRVTTGYTYIDNSGKRVTVRHQKLVPKGKLSVEEWEYDDLGARKFVIEMKYSVEQLVKLGWCPDPNTEEGKQWCVRQGKRYKNAPDPKGEYIFCRFLSNEETAPVAEYRDVVYEDIEQIHLIYNRSLNETDAERVERKKKEAELIEKQLRRIETTKELIAWEDAIRRVDNRSRGLVYG